MSDGFTVHITLDSKLEELTEVMKKEVNDVVHMTGLDVQRTWKQGIRLPPKTGRVYMIRGKPHRASAPGQYPANLTGTLMNSVRVDNKKKMQSVVWQDDTAAPWGFWLELGVTGPINIEPRPHMRPSAEAHRDPFVNKVKEVLAGLGKHV